MPSVRPFCTWKWLIAFNFKCFFAFFFLMFFQLSRANHMQFDHFTVSLDDVTGNMADFVCVCTALVEPVDPYRDYYYYSGYYYDSV